jgi:hypothetical protein
MLFARGRPGDQHKAKALLREAQEAARELGMSFLAARMQAWSALSKSTASATGRAAN